ncbi:MAG: alpha-amylase family glycosyl hydrolase [Succinivibrionaceae bacterium]
MKLKFKKLAMYTMPCVVAMALSACGGSSSSGGSSSNSVNWEAEKTDVVADVSSYMTTIPEKAEGCNIPEGQLMVSGGKYDDYYIWAWNEDGNILGSGAEWPGTKITDNKVAACKDESLIYAPTVTASTSASDTKSLEGYHIIVSNNKKDGDALQAGEIGVYTSSKPCLRMIDERTGIFVTAEECGASIVDEAGSVIEDNTAPYNLFLIGSDKKIVDNSKAIVINEKEGDESTKSVTLSLLITGKGISANSEAKGFYWFDDNEDKAVEFVNGQEIVIGKQADASKASDKKIKSTLNLKYVDESGAESRTSYKIEKTFKPLSTKDENCRLNKQKETLGAIYSSEKTIFRVWSPDSKDVKVTVDGTDYELNPVQYDCYSSLYEVEVAGDLSGKEYQLKIAGVKVRDPYGKMVANGNDTANIIMDMSKTDPNDGWVESPKLTNREDSIVYEVHVRDFTIDKTSGVSDENRGRYLGMVETGTTVPGTDIKTGIDHLKELGVTHVQLQPVYDFKTCANKDSQAEDCYNWGYDPWNYNVPEERYSTAYNTDDYVTRIKEFKTMINEFHKNGIRVIMDVVYNHTFDDSVFKNISSKYYLNKDLSGCGNTVNADENMVWTMIRDSMNYWVEEYHIDGFRMDLVGAFATQDYSDWGVYLNKMHPNANLLIYGEPWAADNDEVVVNEPVRTGRMYKTAPEAHVGAFNNRIRNCLKGSSDNGNNLGFIFNKVNDGWDGNGNDENDKPLEGNKECVFLGVKAGVRSGNEAVGTDVWSAQGFADPEQTISYVTAHDNLALRDKIEAAKVISESDQAKALQVYANSILSTSQGVTFIHGGEEIGRTKAKAGKDMHNTYNTTTGANDFIWSLKAEGWKSVFDSYASYIHMRKEHPAFRMTTADLINANVTLDERSTEDVIIIDINGSAVADKWSKIKVVMNSSLKDVDIGGLDGYKKVADGVVVGDVENNTTALHQAVSIWAVEAEKLHEQLYIVGNFAESESWSKFIPMEYDQATKKWSAKITIAGETEYKVTAQEGWKGTNYGSDDDICDKNTLCAEAERNAVISDFEVGSVVIVSVNDEDMTVEIKSAEL